MKMNNDLKDILHRRLGEKRANSAVCNMVRGVAPSSTANLGPGFDVFGMALDLFSDIVQIDLVSERGVTVQVGGLDHERVSTAVDKNTAGFVAKLVLDTLKKPQGLVIRLTKGVPVGRGLGSSAASAAACVVALDALFGLGLRSDDLVRLVAYGEVAAAGAVHFDNAAAAVLGGFVVVSQKPFKVSKFEPPTGLEVAVASPNVELPKEKTKVMRNMLPGKVDLGLVTNNVAHASLFVAGMALSDIDMIGDAMSDSIVEPIRSKMIPMFSDVKRAAYEAGASGVAISGAGPTMLAVCNSARVNAKDVAHAMKEAFERGNVSCEAYWAKPSSGASVVEKR